ncbi:Alpha-1,6-mannosylglycoprotein 6-beta-N-acetylglucosaminyltransferase A [Collichthys lucidus]|uniref:Alpha-1,6-mannosylglycoprotein 6-beta-N-acetylglucosaminyltransferase A n=1 Tax=Collichthys lucidus TaxID=240159 RepID=A0A4U5TXL1_COLLU|nr:Alpha-1,6-mannosylglycoprotein 6-beta-N-acetylglucosaminyltransferase A [Collichthys lucidus]
MLHWQEIVARVCGDEVVELLQEEEGGRLDGEPAEAAVVVVVVEGSEGELGCVDGCHAGKWNTWPFCRNLTPPWHCRSFPPIALLYSRPTVRKLCELQSLDASGRTQSPEMLLSDEDGSEKEIAPTHVSHPLPPLPENPLCQVSMATPFLWKLSSQKLGFFLVSFGFIWGMMLLHFTIQQRASHENSAVLRQQILDLSKRYIKALAEENQSVMDGPYVGTMTAYDLKKTLAVLLDNIMLRLGKLESKVENIYNGTGGNLTNGTSTATPSATNAEKVNVAGIALGLVVLLHLAKDNGHRSPPYRIETSRCGLGWRSAGGRWDWVQQASLRRLVLPRLADVANQPPQQCFICGPGPMAWKLKDELQGLNVNNGKGQGQGFCWGLQVP